MLTTLRKDIGDMNDGIVKWSDDRLRDFGNELDSLGVKHYKYSPNRIALKKALKRSIGKKYDAINKISYSMPKSAIMLHKGVGRGHPITNPRTAKEWYAPIVEKNMDALGDIVMEGQGNMIINSLNI